MPPGRCLRVGSGVDLDALVASGRITRGDAEAVKAVMAYLGDVAGSVAAGASRDEAVAAAYAEHFPEDRPSDDVENQAGETRQGDGGNP